MKTILAAATAALLLTACGAETDHCSQAQNPAECRAWTDAGGDLNDYLVGGMIGYMLANRGGQTVIVRDDSYYGPVRRLRRPIPDVRDQIIRSQRAKIERQRTELRRQQEARRQSTSSSSSRSSSSPRSFGGGGGRRGR